jgi:Glycosyl transferases group 1
LRLILGHLRSRLRTPVLALLNGFEKPLLIVVQPVNRLLAILLRNRVIPGSVLHVSYMVHIPHQTVALLRRHGVKADYLAVGRSPYWDRCDYNFVPSSLPVIGLLREFWWFWRIVARYEVVHAHFMYTLSRSGWEIPLLKRMGRRLIAHFRGCEARDRNRNMALHPAVNICQECDHRPPICALPLSQLRRELAARFANTILVTTPDMRDFLPNAQHFPFLAPTEALLPPAVSGDKSGEFRIVHLTSQPGIEGTARIRQAVDNLRAKGYRIRFDWIHDKTQSEALAATAGADLAIGKMKMGYYANAQIESMAMGIPTVTHVREEFMTDALRDSGFIFSTLEELETTIAHYLDHPAELAAKRQRARTSILALHDNDRLAGRLIALYQSVKDVSTATTCQAC